MKSVKNSFFIGLAAMALSGAASVYAQASTANSGPSAGKMDQRGMPGPGGMDHAGMTEKMKARMAKHKDELHDKLKLTAAQEPAWKTFTDAMMPGAMPARPDRAAMDKMTAPERLEMMLAKSKEREAKMETRLAALKTFYAVLTPEQKKILDTSHARMDHRMHGGKHGH
jgi:protein CpxP